MTGSILASSLTTRSSCFKKEPYVRWDSAVFSSQSATSFLSSTGSTSSLLQRVLTIYSTSEAPSLKKRKVLCWKINLTKRFDNLYTSTMLLQDKPLSLPEETRLESCTGTCHSLTSEWKNRDSLIPRPWMTWKWCASTGGSTTRVKTPSWSAWKFSRDYYTTSWRKNL